MKKEEVIQKLNELLGKDLVAVYQVGISDNSSLSDTDIVVVTSNVPRTKKILADARDLPFDVRGIFTIVDFQKEARFLPYTEFIHLSGASIAFDQSDSKEESLIKIAGMFFYAFLRNYYRLRTNKASTEKILISLNDFEYAARWLSESEEKLSAFLHAIREARKNPNEISSNEAHSLLEQGITLSWWLIDTINQKLASSLPLPAKTLSRFALRENTAFIDGGADTCRAMTEKSLLKNSITKKLFLPLNFKKIIGQSQGTFAYEYARRNLVGPRFGRRGWLKHGIKMIA